ncbi:MAG: hypothetical protein B7Z38_03640 [Rhodobacterales bacterium 12-64-8]|nr:MAG: hypothetical protein B7Z38_03640 [Rhodobacterales bacterium 12-64-8]
MNEARFMELLGAYGADLARWPEDERTHAEVFLDGASHRVKDVWESERSFDHLLALEKDVPPPIALETVILGSASVRRQASRPLDLFARFNLPRWATGGALAASLALGLAVGYAGEPDTSLEQDYATILTVASGGAGSMLLSAMNDAER